MSTCAAWFGLRAPATPSAVKETSKSAQLAPRKSYRDALLSTPAFAEQSSLDDGYVLVSPLSGNPETTTSKL